MVFVFLGIISILVVLSFIMLKILEQQLAREISHRNISIEYIKSVLQEKFMEYSNHMNNIQWEMDKIHDTIGILKYSETEDVINKHASPKRENPSHPIFGYNKDCSYFIYNGRWHVMKNDVTVCGLELEKDYFLRSTVRIENVNWAKPCHICFPGAPEVKEHMNSDIPYVLEECALSDSPNIKWNVTLDNKNHLVVWYEYGLMSSPKFRHVFINENAALAFAEEFKKTHSVKCWADYVLCSKGEKL